MYVCVYSLTYLDLCAFSVYVCEVKLVYYKYFTYMRSYIHTYIHIHLYIRTYIHTYIHAYIRPYMHTYRLIHTLILIPFLICLTLPICCKGSLISAPIFLF